MQTFDFDCTVVVYFCYEGDDVGWTQVFHVPGGTEINKFTLKKCKEYLNKLLEENEDGDEEDEDDILVEIVAVFPGFTEPTFLCGYENKLKYGQLDIGL